MSSDVSIFKSSGMPALMAGNPCCWRAASRACQFADALDDEDRKLVL
jgi:hypothetical protein